MTRKLLAAALVAVACALGAGAIVGSTPPATNVPASASFDNSIEMGMLSDDGTLYSDGKLNVNCVRSWFSPARGNFYFRTASDAFCDYHNGIPSGATRRQVRLDFTRCRSEAVPGHVPACPSSVEDAYGNRLDLCGLNLIPDLRLITDDLFKGGALDALVLIDFDLYPNFVNETAFRLQFLQRVPISALGASRRLQAPTTAIAELSVRKGPESALVPVARYYMPFSITVTPCPTSGCS
jgi:hypothetical protein